MPVPDPSFWRNGRIPILNRVVQLTANKRPTNSGCISTIVFRLSAVLVLIIVYHILGFFISIEENVCRYRYFGGEGKIGIEAPCHKSHVPTSTSNIILLVHQVNMCFDYDISCIICYNTFIESPGVQGISSI